MEKINMTLELLQKENAELHRAVDVLTAQKDLLRSELEFYYIFDKDTEEQPGSKTELITDLKLRSRIFTAHYLLDVLLKYVSRGKDKDGNDINIIDMSFIEFVDFIFCRGM